MRFTRHIFPLCSNGKFGVTELILFAATHQCMSITFIASIRAWLSCVRTGSTKVVPKVTVEQTESRWTQCLALIKRSLMTREGNTGSDGMWWAKKLFKKQSKREGKKKQRTERHGKFTSAIYVINSEHGGYLPHVAQVEVSAMLCLGQSKDDGKNRLWGSQTRASANKPWAGLSRERDKWKDHQIFGELTLRPTSGGRMAAHTCWGSSPWKGSILDKWW